MDKALQVFSSGEMKAYDAWVQDKFKISETILVEHAGRECFKAFIRHVGLKHEAKITVLCGSGGNGADGLVMARLLACYAGRIDHSISIQVILTKEIKDQRELNQNLLRQLLVLGVECRVFDDIDFEVYREILSQSDYIVDALLGTGIKGSIQSSIHKMLSAVKENRSGESVLIAIDLPSGVDADFDIESTDPYLAGAAECSFVIQGYKPFHMSPGSERYCGHSYLLDIGMPINEEILPIDSKYLVSEESIHTVLSGESDFYLSYKGKRGHVFVIGGSSQMAGAPLLSSLAVFKSGGGKVTATFPKHSPCSSPLVIGLPLKVEDGVYLETENERIIAGLKGKQAVVVGPGLGVHPRSQILVKLLVSKLKNLAIPCVLDADALNLISAIREQGEFELSDNFILTPHAGEFLKLEMAYFGDSLLVSSRYDAVRRLALAIGANVLLKGPKSIYFDLIDGAYYNPHQAASLAVAGSGDLLSGLIAGHCARGLNIQQAVKIAVFIHGLTGEILDREYTNGIGVDAFTILESVSKSYKEISMN